MNGKRQFLFHSVIEATLSWQLSGFEEGFEGETKDDTKIRVMQLVLLTAKMQ